MTSKRKADAKLPMSKNRKKSRPYQQSCWCSWKDDCKAIRSQLLNYSGHSDYSLWTREYIRININKNSDSNQKYLEVLRRHLGVEGDAKQYYIAPHHYPIALLKWKASLIASDNRHIKWGDPIPAEVASSLKLSTEIIDLHPKSSKQHPKYCQVPNVTRDQLHDIIKSLRPTRSHGLSDLEACTTIVSEDVSGMEKLPREMPSTTAQCNDESAPVAMADIGDGLAELSTSVQDNAEFALECQDARLLLQLRHHKIFGAW